MVTLASRRIRPSYRKNIGYKKYYKAASAIATGAASLYRMGKSYTGTRKGTKVTGGVTSQYDRKVVYQRKPMPTFKRRNWARFSKKVNAVINKQLSTRTILLNESVTIGLTESGTLLSQGYSMVHLYGSNGLNYSSPAVKEIGANDISQMMFNDSDVNNLNKKMRFKSAVLDLTYRNQGEQPIEVDIYDIVYWGDKHTTSFTTDQIVCEGVVPEVGSAAPITLNTRGATPFDFPTHLRYGIKILRKTKYLLAVNEAATYQIRDSKDRFISWTGVGISTSFVNRKMTRSVLAICKPLTSYSSGSQSWAMTTGCTRKYSYVDFKQEDKEGKLI